MITALISKARGSFARRAMKSKRARFPADKLKLFFAKETIYFSQKGRCFNDN